MLLQKCEERLEIDSESERLKTCGGGLRSPSYRAMENHIQRKGMNKMNQTQTRSPRKRLLSLILAVILMIGLLPISAFATSASAQAGEDKAATQDSEFLRIFHLDCGRKYFTVSEIEGIIDQLAENHFTHIQLAFGNDGLRFLLDDMSLTVNGTEYDSKKVTAAIKNGNSSYNSDTSAASGELNQGDMDAIIKYANDKGIQVIPMFNAPGHMYTVVKAKSELGMGNDYKNVETYGQGKSPNWAIKPTDETAVAFAEALLQKYAAYFASKGSTMFNVGADESGLSSDNYLAYAKMVNEMNAIVKSNKVNGEPMKTLAYNDGIYHTSYSSALKGKGENGADFTFDTDIIICYWTDGANLATVETLLGKGFEVLNNTNDWYYVLGDFLFQIWAGGQWGYETALNGIKNTPVTRMKDGKDYANSKQLLGSILCVWCDGPSVGYTTGYGYKATNQTNQQSVYNLIKTMAEQNPDYFTGKVKLSASDDVTGVSVAVTGAKGQKATVEVKKITSGFTFDTEAHVSYNVTPAVDGKAYTGEGTVTLPVPEGWATEASRIHAYIIDNGAVKLISGTLSGGKYTFQVPHFSEMGLVQLAEGAPSKTENITLTVGGTKTVSVDGIQEIVTAPNGQCATATTTTIPAGAVSYTATASASIAAYQNYYNASNLIDGNTSTFYWSGDAQTAGAYAQVDLGAAIPFDAVRLTSTGNDACTNADILVSADGASWTKVGSYTGTTTPQVFENTLGSVRYIKVIITTDSNKWWQLAEIEWGNYIDGQFTRMAASGTVTVPERTSISFTGVAVGNTTAVIGDTQYNITVNGRVEIPISIIDYRADGLLFDWNYLQGTYSNSYRYGLVHGKSGSNGYVVATKDSTTGLYTVDGNDSAVEQIAGTKIEQTGPVNSTYGTTFYTGNLDNSWSRAGLVQEKLGTNGMPVYTDAAVRYVASLLKAGYYNDVSNSAYNCNSYIYKTFVAADGKRPIHNTSTTAFSAQFEVTKSYNDIKTAYDLAWYLLNTIYQPDTEATVPVTDVNGQQREVPLYGMAVDTYKSIVLTDGGNGKYTFEAGYESNKVEYPRNVNFDRENGKIYNGGGDEKNLGFYPLEGLGYEQNDLLENTSFTDSKHRNGGFTLRGESQFVYNEGANLYFTFTGDDDVYMYINGVLALDLGGAHGRNTKTVKLDSLDKDTYKLKDGEVATFTFFYMERCSDASTFGIETNMKLVQRDIAVEKNAYSDSQYTRPVNSGAVVDNGRDLFYDLVVTNKGNTVMTNFTFEDTDSFTGKANLGFGVTDASVTAGSEDKDKNLVSLSTNGYTYFVTDADGNQVGETKTVASLEELSAEVANVELAANQSLHVRFLKATVNVAKSKIISYTNTVKVTASAGGARLWGDGSHSIYAYNDGGTARTYVVDFGLPLKIEKIFDPSAKTYIDNASGTIALNGQPKYGTAELTAAGYGSSVVYRLNAHTTIDGQDTITLNVPYKFDDAERTLPKTLNIIPASNVYYEDSLAAFTNGKGVAENAKWSTVGNDDKVPTEQTDVYQALEELGKHSNVYGHDGAYNSSSMLSMGTAHKVTVTAAMLAKWDDTTSAWPTAQFTFKGTGFDIISLTNNKSGTIFVDVTNTATGKQYNYVVNNYYGYTYQSGEWVVDKNASDTLYQIPVMKVDGLDYGEYNVVIKVAYNKFFDTAEAKEYSFWLDAVRIYDPMGEYADYTKDNEGYPQYIKLRDTLAKSTIGTTLFIDGKDSATIAEYANYGPNNEVYLMNGQAITFKIPQNANVDSIQIGAKAPNGNTTMTVTGTNDTVLATEALSTATEMYYKINVNVSAADQTVVIANKDGTGILSLTNLKITFKNKPTDKITLTALNNQEQENAVSLVRALFTAPVATFSPETFEADWGRAVRAGKRATLTVKTSADVESITVDGQSITGYTTRTQRTGWGWWSPKVTYHVFTYTITAPAQTTDYAVCAVNAEGTASEAVTATLTVKPTTWWNWWF